MKQDDIIIKMTFPEFLEKKYLEWQLKEGERKTRWMMCLYFNPRRDRLYIGTFSRWSFMHQRNIHRTNKRTAITGGLLLSGHFIREGWHNSMPIRS